MTDPGTASERRLDANAAGGPLAELFTVDLTAAVATCASCGNAGPLAEHDLYADAPALVVRCRNCTAVVLRYADRGGTIRFEMTGARLLTVAVPTDPLPTDPLPTDSV
jgi:ribosomal protein S27E